MLRKKKKKKKERVRGTFVELSPHQRKRQADTFLCVNAANKWLLDELLPCRITQTVEQFLSSIPPPHVFFSLLTVVARSNVKRPTDYHGNAEAQWTAEFAPDCVKAGKTR